MLILLDFLVTSKALTGSEINNIKIYGKKTEIKKLSEKHAGLEIYLAIPSLSLDQRRKIVSDLEKYQENRCSEAYLHCMKIVADQKTMAGMTRFTQ